MIAFFNWFTKITGWPAYRILFRTKVLFEDREKQGRRIHGPAIVISNHTSVFDYAVMLFVFYSRTLRTQMAEVLFRKKGPLPLFLKCMGGIYVDRDSHDFGFIEKSARILRKGGVVLIFPESRIPLPEEERPLPFVPSAALAALETNVPVIPVFTNGSYFNKKPARVIVGTPLNPAEYVRPEMTEAEKIESVTAAFREKITRLGEELNEREKR
ncbi:MAG: 1-acyl-sn-glycerol-3-phosphate acyltransferase [Lachnospiraceae bacterium]|nr:1-acyl-sn-glycerol-3-phosphate acyltransferase [Lachnospiraceae bacterium]